jgi:hypothetical protein
MPLSDRLQAKREAESGPIESERFDAATYEKNAQGLADTVSRLGVYRSRSDRARIIHQLTDIERRAHELLEYVRQ